MCDTISAGLVRGVTKWLRVDYKKGLTTVPSVWKLCTWVSRHLDNNGRRKLCQVQLSDGATGEVHATAEGEFIDLRQPRL